MTTHLYQISNISNKSIHLISGDRTTIIYPHTKRVMLDVNFLIKPDRGDIINIDELTRPIRRGNQRFETYLMYNTKCVVVMDEWFSVY